MIIEMLDLNLLITNGDIELQSMREQDLNGELLNWLNDKDVVAFSQQKYEKYNFFKLKSYWCGFIEREDLYLKIVTKKDQIMIGTMTVYFNTAKTVGDIGILIGDKSFWNKGYGFHAWSLLLSYLFKEQKLQCITGGCDIRNSAMINIFEKTGMKPFKRETIHRDFEEYEVIRYRKKAEC